MKRLLLTLLFSSALLNTTISNAGIDANTTLIRECCNSYPVDPETGESLVAFTVCLAGSGDETMIGA